MNLKQKTVLIISALLLLVPLFSFYGCTQAVLVCATSDLMAGQTIHTGKVNVWFEADNAYFQYTTADSGWVLSETQLHIATSLAEIPQTKTGNPIPGKFAYKADHIPPVNTYTYKIPLSTLNTMGYSTCDQFANITFYIAAHAVVAKQGSNGLVQQETAWAGDSNFSGKNWARYFTCVVECIAPPPEETCETAFAYDANLSTCFLNIDENNDGKGDFSRWGWTNGPLSNGKYTFSIYAAAGQCDITKGTLVGTLTVDYQGSTATVTYTTNSGFSMDETHLYIGQAILPRDRKSGDFTVAPGQYGHIHTLNKATKDVFTVNGLSGDIYVVAHAVVCGAYK